MQYHQAVSLTRSVHVNHYEGSWLSQKDEFKRDTMELAENTPQLLMATTVVFSSSLTAVRSTAFAGQLFLGAEPKQLELET